ncbi:putative bifunctional diguanylate cyclase/phosphodiesterase [Teredinibacter haidensis]|uniref:putative bifunctional diguanylate cyclase/phosphodiesterase n=1 Tax=Teredinibacter haidensis TaxID=2731755 RepID=UPI001FE2CA31|nr:EAL domain-containing protein [Teredinibacter haidensis]
MPLIVDASLIAVAIILVTRIYRRRQELSSKGFTRALSFAGFGIVILAGTALLHLYTNTIVLRFLQVTELPNALSTWLPLYFGIGVLLIFIGLESLINRVIPKSTQKLTELVAIREKLAASNDELARTIATRNQELEIHNITLQQVLEDQQISRKALLQSEKKFHALFDKSPAIFLTINNLHAIADINLYGAKSLGYDTAFLVGQPFSMISSPEDIDKQQTFIDFCLANPGEKMEIELRCVKNNTQKFWVKASGNLVQEADGEDYLLLVCQDITDSKQLAESLSYQAKHDELTGLYNRRTLELFLERTLKKKAPNSPPTALIYIDVDQLKVVNDTCSHKAGDEFIRQLVKKINEYNQQFDFFARIGGDEFAIVIASSSEQQALELAEILRNTAEDFTFKWKELSFRQSVSIGIALSSREIHSIVEMLATADAACFSAKQAGRNRVVLHREASESNDTNRTEMLWVSRLQTALMRDRFELYFQPIINMNDLRSDYMHYEVLLRYVDDEGTHISPTEFLPAAERFGLTNQIDLWVLTTTLDFLQRNTSHTENLSCCSINLSSQSLSSHQSRMAIKQLVMTANIELSKICFEITETSAIHNLSEAISFINELKTLGCRFALDDFGTGFSSFGYLRNLDVDYIKIDGSFIQDITNDRLGQAMVKAINMISKEMGITTIAEYVENQAIAKELLTMGIFHGQGFGLAKPMPMIKSKEYYALKLRHHQVFEK